MIKRIRQIPRIPNTHTTRLLLVVLLALALRLALWSQPLHEPANDENEYIAVAYDVLEGRGWVFYEHYHWLRAPLYPLFLAGSLWLAGGDLHLAALPNVALSVATVYLIALLTSTLFAAHPARDTLALVAALTSALLFTFATFASLFMSETLFSFCFTAALLLLLRWHHTPARRHLLLLAGLCYGLATLTRSVTTAFLPLVLLWIVASVRSLAGAAWGGHIRTRLLPAALFALCVLLPIAPWTLRNCQAYGRCILVETGLSYNLWAFSEPHEDMGEIFRTLEAIPNPAERADEATRRGMERLREDPSILLRKPWPNWVVLWRIKPIQDRFLLPTYYTDPPPLVFLGALLFDDALYLAILLGAAVGVTATVARQHPRWPLVLPLAWVAYIAATTMMTHGEGRYRHFIFPVLIPLAAAGWYAVALWLKRRGPLLAPHTRRRTMVASLLSTALLAAILYPLLTLYPWKWAGGGAVRSIYRIAGDVALATGNPTAAESAYLNAYAAQKTADGRLILGRLYEQQGRLAAAEEQYRSGWERKRRYVAATAHLGDILRTRGREEEARDAFAGYFMAQQAVTDWSWEHITPTPTTFIDVGGGLDFGYVGGVYNAEEQQGATARWTNGHGTIKLVRSATPTTPRRLRLRLAAPHPDAQQVPARVCVDGLCQPITLRPTWRIVSLLVPPPDTPVQRVDLYSPTFRAPDGRTPGVLLDWIAIFP